MINDIYSNQDLAGLIRNSCEDNGLSVEIHQDLLGADGMLDFSSIAILKIDEFYNAQNVADRPKSIDYLVAVKCCDDSYSLYLIELKNTRDKSQMMPRDVLSKFKTTVEDFICNKFSGVFDNRNYKKIEMYLVSQKLVDKAHDKSRSSFFDAYMTAKPFKLLNHAVWIQPENPPIEIVPC